jgi:YVTN family beta-propeller protein
MILKPSSALFILLDQFEEFFIRLQDETIRDQFIDELGECVDDEILRVRFVLSLRADNFANLSDFRTRIPFIFNNEYALKLLTRDEAASAIKKPAESARLSYEQGMVDEILDELQKNEHHWIMPAQLQLVCWALYQEVRDTGQAITHTALQQMGGVAAILGNYLKRVIDKEVSTQRRAQARQVLEALVRSDRTRDIKTEAELARVAGPVQTLPIVLEQLVASRLLRVIEDDTSNEAAAYELAHDYLIPQVELDPETLARKAAQELLDQEVEAWQRNPKFRIGDEKLKIIKAQEKKIVFTSEAQELYAKSKRDQRRRRGFLYGFLGAAILGLLGAIIFFRFWTDAEERRATAEGAVQLAEERQATAVRAADAAEARQATAQNAADVAEIARADAVAAEATAQWARQEAEAGQEAATIAEATAIAARNVAETLQAQAEASEADAVAAQQTAQVGEAMAQTAEAQAAVAQLTAQAGQATAQANQATAQARQSEAEEAAQRAVEAQAAAEAARAEAERAREAAEEAAAQAEQEKRQAEEAARNAEATRTAAEALRDQAEADLARTRQLTAIIRNTQNCPVDSDPTSDPRPEAVAYDGNHIWVINKGTNEVTKIEAGNCSIVASYPAGNGPSDVIYGGGFIWVADSLDNVVRKIDPNTGSTVLPLFEAGPTGSEPTALLYADNVIWATSTNFFGNQNKLRKIDPTTGANLGTIDTGLNPSDLAFGGGYVWVANRDDDEVLKIDATNLNVTASFPVGGLRPSALLYDGNHIWVANQVSDKLAKLQISDGKIVLTPAVGHGPDALASDGFDVWSANEDDNTLTRINTQDGTRWLDVPTGREPTAILFDGANMWVVAELDNLLQKISYSKSLIQKYYDDCQGEAKINIDRV